MGDELDDETQLIPEEPSAEALGEAGEEEIAEDGDPGATDLLRAAQEGAKRLEKLEP